jgi:hypothetical protein
MIKVFEIILCMYLKTISPDVPQRRKRLGQASPFPPFLSPIHILPICFDSAQVWYIYLNFQTYINSKISFLVWSLLSWRPVLVVEEAGVPGENHRPWQATGKLYHECTLSCNVQSRAWTHAVLDWMCTYINCLSIIYNCSFVWYPMKIISLIVTFLICCSLNKIWRKPGLSFK